MNATFWPERPSRVCGHECHCDCHSTGAVHIVACCDRCGLPGCGRNIKDFFKQDHLRICHGQNIGRKDSEK